MAAGGSIAQLDSSRSSFASAGGRGVGWTVILVSVFLAVTAGLAAMILGHVSSVSRAADLQAFQRLAISAQGFAGWPEIAQKIGQRSLPITNGLDASSRLSSPNGPAKSPLDLLPSDEKPSLDAIHPQFGRLPLQYKWAQKEGNSTPPYSCLDRKTGAPGNGQNVRFDPAGLEVWGRTMTFDDRLGEMARSVADAHFDSPVGSKPRKEGERYLCYYFGPLPYQNVLSVPDGFQALLLFRDTDASPDKTVQPDQAKASGKLAAAPASTAAQSQQAKASGKLAAAPASTAATTDGGKAETEEAEPYADPGDLVAHVGADILPVRNISDIPDLSRLLHRTAPVQPTLSGADAASATNLTTSIVGSVLRDNQSEFLTPLNVTIAGRAYRLYVYPISVALQDGQIKRMLVVGVTIQQSTLMNAKLNSSYFALIGLLLIALLVLTPFIRMANLGPVDGLKPIDIVVIVISLTAGTAIAMTIVFLAADTLKIRSAVDKRLEASASMLAKMIGAEIFSLSSCNLSSVQRTLQISKNVFQNMKMPECSGSPAWAKLKSISNDISYSEPSIANPDQILFLDKDGLPPKAGRRYAPILAYTKRPGPFYASGDRLYFSRANNRDVVSGTEQLAAELGQHMGLFSTGKEPASWVRDGTCNGTRCGIAIQQILSRGDGVAKTLVALPIAPCNEAIKTTILCEAQARVVAVSFIMKSLLAPSLPPAVNYAVIDVSQQPSLPSIFHSDPDRANAERFSLSLDPPTLAKFNAATRRPSEACNGEKSVPSAASFSGSYIGEDQRFAVALAPCTDWAVVTFSPMSLIDEQGALPSEVAFLAWLGLALPCGLLLALGLAAARYRWNINLRMLWPNPRLRDVYYLLATMLSAFFIAVSLLHWFELVPTWVLLASVPFAGGAAIVLIFWSTQSKEVVACCQLTSAALRRWFVFGQGDAQLSANRARRNDWLPAERAYAVALCAFLLTLAALPVELIATDAFRYEVAREKAETDQAKSVAANKLERELALISKSQFPDSVPPPASSKHDNEDPLASSKINETPLPLQTSLPPPPPLAMAFSTRSFTADLLCLVRGEACNSPPSNDGSGLATSVPSLEVAKPFPIPSPKSVGSYGVLFYIAWGLLALLAGMLPLTMVAILCRNLFGFGVPLEAVRYPRIRPGPDLALLESDDGSFAAIWAERFPRSTLLKPDDSEGPIKRLARSQQPGWDRVTARIHEADWKPDDLRVLLKRLLYRQEQLKQVEAPPPGADDARSYQPSAASYFRIVLVVRRQLIPEAGILSRLGKLFYVAGENGSERAAYADLLKDFVNGDSPPYEEEHAPARAILVAGGDDFQHRLRTFAGKRTIDLYEARDKKIGYFQELLPDAPPVKGAPCPLMIVHNLELLLRDAPGRQSVLKLLEDLVRAQGGQSSGTYRQKALNFRLLLLADISPLDRFLQATEWRDAEEERVDRNKTGSAADPSENIRWSRLLENFTTYTGRVEPRPREDTPPRPTTPAMEYLLDELAYLPDRVVSALLPDHDGILQEDEIRDWGTFLENSREAAIADFLAAQLIEHYHYLWSISSRAEQILIHRMASGELPLIRQAYALRSLVRRGIVVLDPAPKIMNDSFQRFVASVGRPDVLQRWKHDAPQGGWTKIHGNLTVVMPILLLLGGVLIVRGIIGVEAAVPIIAAASSALLRPLFAPRATT